MNEFDAIVIGVGGMGSATLYHLARRGWKVLGLEQYDVPHEMGSSHGYSRMIRYTLQEHPSYVPLVRRAYELWHQLENASRERLLITTGSIRAGHAESDYFQGAVAACEEHNIPYEVLTGTETSRRFPGYRLDQEIAAVYQADGGFLLPERCIVNHANAALEAGAEIHGREQVLDWQPSGEGVEVRTSRGNYRAARLVLTAGAWASKIIPSLSEIAVAERQVLGWFQPERPDLFRTDTFPVFGMYVEEGRFYGFPVYGVPGFKVGRSHHLHQTVDPDQIDREIYHEDEAVLRNFVERYFPAAAGPALSLKTCMFTNSPDGHFIIDLHPDHPQVSLASGFSGHGFKFASVIGEIMADLAMFGQTTHDLSLFRLGRLDAGPQRGVEGDDRF
jgi:sarcosine oxidase